jgi:hypothetical protein
MKALTAVCLAVGLMSVLLGTASGSKIVSLLPVSAVDLAADADGSGRVALRFDLSGVKLDPGKKIALALVEWRLDGVSIDDIAGNDIQELEFVAHEATSGWTEAGVGQGELPLMEEEGEIDSWLVTPRDFEVNEGCYVRLNVTELAQRWFRGEANHGIVVLVRGVAANKITPEAGDARLLIKPGLDLSSRKP